MCYIDNPCCRRGCANCFYRGLAIPFRSRNFSDGFLAGCIAVVLLAAIVVEIEDSLKDK
jgi:hypothetical protein